ncbi:hypothetical protein BGW41_006458 [Actinomortierella wolfii]|nr:hypothetical protein BGW41_006458 [Actinomortierella wolfii]
MARFLSKPITFLALSVIQICNTIKLQSNSRSYRIRLGDLYLQPDEIDGPVHFVPNVQHECSSVWEVTHVDEYRVIIRHPQMNGYLSYIDPYPGAVLMLRTQPKYWTLRKVDNDDECFDILAPIGHEGRPLAIENHPLKVWPPLAGLGFRYRHGSPSLVLERVIAERDNNAQSCSHPPAIGDGTYFICIKGRYLTAACQPGDSARLSYYPSEDAQWTIQNHYSCEKIGAMIRSDSTGLYLSFNHMVPGAKLTMQREPRLWTLDEIRETIFAIHPAKDQYHRTVLNATNVSSGRWAMAGLAQPGRNVDQEWEILSC